MAPQKPFSQFPKASSLYIGPEALLQEPQIAARIMYLIGLFSEAEMGFAAFFADLLGVDAPIGIELFNALTGSSSQSALFDVAIRQGKLDAEQLTMLHALKKWRTACAKVRNELAHSTLAYCKELPNSILTVSPERTLRDAASNAKWSAEFLAYAEEGYQGSPPEHPLSFTSRGSVEIDRTGVMVFRATDIEEHIADVAQLRNAIQSLRMGIFSINPRIRAKVLQQLKTLPRIEKALSEAQKNDSQTQ